MIKTKLSILLTYPNRAELESRFWVKVQKSSNGCWLWVGQKSKKGYGNFQVSKKDGIRITASAHRLSWELANGLIENNLLVCHKCDNPSCVNPEHLFLGTPKENTQDCIKKGRYVQNFPPRNKGHDVPVSKLKEADVRKIIQLRDRGLTQESIGAIFGVAQMTVSDILRGKTWKHITSEKKQNV